MESADKQKLTEHLAEMSMAWANLEPQVRAMIRLYARRVADHKAQPYVPRIPLGRTTVAEQAHVMCLATDNPKALNKYIREVNTFWTNIYLHGEEERVANWKPPVLLGPVERIYPTDMELAWYDFNRIHGLPQPAIFDSMSDVGIVERTAWDSLSQVQIEPKGQS